MPAAGVQPMTWIKHVFIVSYLGLLVFIIMPIVINLEYDQQIGDIKSNDITNERREQIIHLSGTIDVLVRFMWTWLGGWCLIIMASFVRLGSHLVTMLTMHLNTASSQGSRTELEHVVHRLRLIVKCLSIGGSSFIPVLIALVSWPWFFDRFCYFLPLW
jgi:hypothetical protein